MSSEDHAPDFRKFSEATSANDKLPDSDIRFKTLIEAIPQIVWITKPDGWNIYFNQRWVEYTGMTMEESHGHGWNKPFHPDDQKLAWDAWQNAVKTDGIYSLECRLRRADGTYHWWLIRGESLHDENGIVINWFGTCTDIEHIKETEEALKLAEEKYRDLVETAPDSFITVNDLGVIEVVNKHAEKCFGYTREEMIGQPVEILLPERFRDNHVKLRTDYSESPKTRPMGEGRELFARRKDGSEFPVEISLSPMSTPKGLLVTSIIRDVTSQKQAFYELEELKKSLETQVQLRTKELKKSEESYRLIVESVNDYAIYRLDLKGNILSWNAGAEKIKGYKASEVIGKNFDIFYTAKDVENKKTFFELETAATQGKFEEESIRLRKDGSEFWASVVISAIRDKEGNLLGFVKVVRDITERKKAEDILRENEKHLNLVLEIAEIGSWTLNTKTQKAWRSLRHDQIFGYRTLLPQWTYSMFLEHVLEEDRKFVDETFGRALKTATDWSFQCRIRTAGGEIRWIEAFGEAKREQNEVVEFTGIVRDITKQKNAAIELQEANNALENEVKLKKAETEKFKVLAEAIPQLCWIANADGFIFWYNQRWYKYTGTIPKDMEGWGWQSVHDQKLLPSVLERWHKSIQTGEPFEMEFPLLGADGNFRWFLTRILPLRDSENNIVNWFGTNTDIDDQKRANLEREELLKEVRVANDQLEKKIQDRTNNLMRSNKELEQFAYIASHDLQTPLRHIASYVQLLIDKVKKTTSVDPQTEKWIGYIISGTVQMKTLINDLLTYSRVGRIDIVVEDVGMRDVVAGVTEVLRESISKVNAKIVCKELPVVRTVKSQMNQLFQNLIENALKFKKADLAPTVEIRCEDQVEFWKFYISDNGIGIDSKHSDRLFTMFQRLHTSNEYSGTGIGLAVCKKIVEFHGGTIGVESTEGNGATFFFTLPKKERVTLLTSDYAPGLALEINSQVTKKTQQA